MAGIARYGTQESTRYFNGVGYVVRRDMHPHTRFTAAGPVTKQGHTVMVGARQGLSDGGGFAYRRYTRPDTEPAYEPARP